MFGAESIRKLILHMIISRKVPILIRPVLNKLIVDLSCKKNVVVIRLNDEILYEPQLFQRY